MAVRLASSSGGVFSMLADVVLSRGGCVYGAAFTSDWSVEHRRIDTHDDLWRLRGSKYVYTNASAAISDALTQLQAGREVLFSGTPCHIAALRQRAGSPKRLTAVEIVCHGAPEARFWLTYLTELCARLRRTVADIASINFRDKRTGWKGYSFTIKFTDGKEFTQHHDDNLYMRAFLSGLTLREACFRCPFKDDGSRADITLGDLWGISQLSPDIDNNLGTTLVIARTPRGLDALTSAAITPLRSFSLSDVARYNPAITTPAARPPSYTAFRDAATSPAILPVFSRFTRRPLMLRLKIMAAKMVHTLIGALRKKNDVTQ